MCFSANASFSASIILTAVGVLSVREINSTSQIPFAIIPFIFAIQQTAEGFVWLSFSNHNIAHYRECYGLLFLVCAYIIWPILVPYSIWKLEKKIIQKKILSVNLICGVLSSLVFGFTIIFYPLEINVSNFHVQYLLQSPYNVLFTGNILYGLATILPEFISKSKRMWLLGLVVLLSYFATYLFYREYVVSVWCFFASIISILIYFILKSMNAVYSVQKSSDDSFRADLEVQKNSSFI